MVQSHAAWSVNNLLYCSGTVGGAKIAWHKNILYLWDTRPFKTYNDTYIYIYILKAMYGTIPIIVCLHNIK